MSVARDEFRPGLGGARRRGGHATAGARIWQNTADGATRPTARPGRRCGAEVRFATASGSGVGRCVSGVVHRTGEPWCISGVVARFEPRVATWMQCRTTWHATWRTSSRPTPDGDPTFESSTAASRIRPPSASRRPRPRPGRPRPARSRPSTGVHAAHSVMMMMTGLEESTKIHTERPGPGYAGANGLSALGASTSAPPVESGVNLP